MTEVVDLLFASRAVRLELNDPAVAAEVRTRIAGFEAPAGSEPWLTVEARTRAEPLGAGRLDVQRQEDGTFHLSGSILSGRFLPDARPPTATVEARGALAVFQGLFACASILLPRAGAILVHADTVERGGRAVALVGQSGAGKSTAARGLLRDPRAHRLALDRTIVLHAANAERPRVVAMPRLQREEPGEWGPPREVELAALLLPVHGKGAEVRPLRPAEAVTRVMGTALLPPGSGLPWEAGLEMVVGLLERVPVAELSFEPGADLAAALERAGYWR